MADVREKLVELLGDVQYLGGLEDKIADHLIANGVTIQKWIPVTERLPDPYVSVLVQMPGENPFPTVREGFISKAGIWHSALYDRDPDEVTHWMPLPEPSKGE